MIAPLQPTPADYETAMHTCCHLDNSIAQHASLPVIPPGTNPTVSQISAQPSLQPPSWAHMPLPLKIKYVEYDMPNDLYAIVELHKR
jgi:hypothetical protein